MRDKADDDGCFSWRVGITRSNDLDEPGASGGEGTGVARAGVLPHHERLSPDRR